MVVAGTTDVLVVVGTMGMPDGSGTDGVGLVVVGETLGLQLAGGGR